VKECDILGDQNVLWPLVHIFRGSRPPIPGSKHLPQQPSAAASLHQYEHPAVRTFVPVIT